MSVHNEMLARNLMDVDNYLTFGTVNTFRYTNYKGETESRTVIPLQLRFGRTEHHPEDQWLLECFDLDRGALRTYALSGVHPR